MLSSQNDIDIHIDDLPVQCKHSLPMTGDTDMGSPRTPSGSVMQVYNS